MLEAAFLALLDSPPVPPAPPPMIEERLYLPRGMEQVERSLRQSVEAFGQQSEDFKRKVHELKLASEYNLPHWDVSEVEPLMKRTLADIEFNAEQRTKMAAQLHKRETRRNKEWFRLAPAIGALHRNTFERVIAIEKANIDEMLNLALYMRAVLADNDPAARSGPEFRDPAELQRFLDAALA